MKKTLSITLSVLFAVFLLLTLVLCIVRTDLSDASLSGLVDTALGAANKVAGKKTAVPGLIKLALSTPFFIAFIVITVAFPAVLIIAGKKLSVWLKSVVLPLLIDGAVLLIASPVAAIIYKAKVPKLVQNMIKSLYDNTQKLILISGAITLAAGGILLAVGLLTGRKSRKRK